MGTILNLLAPGSVLLAMLCACGPGPDAPAEAPPETSTGTEVMAETPAAVTTEVEAESPDESPPAAPDRMRVEVPEDPPADPVVVAPADPPRLPGSTPAVNPRPPSTAPAPPPDAMPEPPSDPVIALLDRLAENDVGLTGFTASITYQKIDALLGRRETRKGRLIYAVDAERAGKRFAILFDSITIGRRKRTQLKHYVFDGRWLAEIDHEGKQFIKREIVAPGRELNPLKLGEGPFPLPIGQPRNEVLRRFEVGLCPRPEEGLLTVLPEDVHGIRLVPRPGTDEAEEFEYVLLFFDRVTLLPVGSHVVERADEAGESDETFVRLADLARNPVLDAADRARLSIEEPDAREWRVDIRPWQER